ncbi:PAS domain-containing protein [Chlorobium sp. N1]|uniref:PAS domain-containing protein n=1 Tax=Chlorobium sp. N1 TaxID=2491138 RepID=UPI00103BEF49|nr:PAS domain-containing protein [Chlorobium sp. N1]TCD48083.1 diguanylate cyclase [Chlorobium sp. N1]
MNSSITPHNVSMQRGFSQRLREYILQKHGSINAFCKAADIKYPAQMTPYLKGRCQPGKKMLDRLRQDGADIEWLLSGHSTAMSADPLGNALVLSRYRMDLESLLRQVRIHMGRYGGAYTPVIEAYAVLDHSARIVELTGSIERFLAYEKNALYEARLDSLIHPEDYPGVESALHEERPEEGILNFNSKFLTGGGEYMDVEWSLYVKNRPMSDMQEYAMILRKSS